MNDGYVKQSHGISTMKSLQIYSYVSMNYLFQSIKKSNSNPI